MTLRGSWVLNRLGWAEGGTTRQRGNGFSGLIRGDSILKKDCGVDGVEGKEELQGNGVMTSERTGLGFRVKGLESV